MSDINNTCCQLVVAALIGRERQGCGIDAPARRESDVMMAKQRVALAVAAADDGDAHTRLQDCRFSMMVCSILLACIMARAGEAAASAASASTATALYLPAAAAKRGHLCTPGQVR